MSSAATPRTIRSYVLRAGRTTRAQAGAITELGPRFLLHFEARTLDFVQVFGRDAPTVLEVGSGMGEATARIAEARPDCNFIACEVHAPGVGALLRRIGSDGTANLRIVRHDAVPVLEQMIAPRALAGVHLYFPDPWHKKRHHKRRLVQPAFARLVAQRLAPGGYLHCVTDWEPYAAQMFEVLSAEPLLANPSGGFAQKPEWRPLTKFESRAAALGATVRELWFVAR